MVRHRWAKILASPHFRIFTAKAKALPLPWCLAAAPSAPRPLASTVPLPCHCARCPASQRARPMPGAQVPRDEVQRGWWYWTLLFRAYQNLQRKALRRRPAKTTITSAQPLPPSTPSASTLCINQHSEWPAAKHGRARTQSNLHVVCIRLIRDFL